MLRLVNGRVSFNWYRLAVTIPERVGDLDPTGSTVVFEVVVDDYAEVWVDGKLPLVLGLTGGHVVGGFNAPNRVVLTRHARPGQRFAVAVFGINGPISTSPETYIWMRTATLDFYRPERAAFAEAAGLRVERDSADLEAIVTADSELERVAGGFEFTEGPVRSPEGALLVSSPNTNSIYRLDPEVGKVTLGPTVEILGGAALRGGRMKPVQNRPTVTLSPSTLEDLDSSLIDSRNLSSLASSRCSR